VSIAEHVGIAIGVDFSMRLLQSERRTREIGLSIRRSTPQEFSLSDGTCFLLRKSGC